MTMRFEEPISTEDEKTWNKYIIGGLSSFILICGPIGAGIWCASTAYSTNSTANEVFEATMNAIFGN